MGTLPPWTGAAPSPDLGWLHMSSVAWTRGGRPAECTAPCETPSGGREGRKASRGVGRTNTKFSLASTMDRFNELSGLELAV